VTGSVQELLRGRDEEEVGLEDLVGLRQATLSLLKVEIDVKGLDESGDRVVVLVVFLAHNAHEILELLLVVAVLETTAVLSRTAAVCDNGSGQVAEEPGSRGLDAVDESLGEKHLGELVARRLVVEHGEECPVCQPDAVLQLCERVAEQTCLDALLHLQNLLQRGLPVGGQNVGGELTPRGSAGLVVVGGQNAVLVEEVRGATVVSARVLELAVLVQLVDHLRGHAVGVLEILQVGSLVSAQVVDDLTVTQQAQDLLGVLLELGALGEGLVALGVVLLRPLGEVIDGGIEVADEVAHVGLLEQGIFGLGDVVDALVLRGLLLEEVEQGEDEVAVQVGDELGQQRVLLRDVGLGVGHGCDCVYMGSLSSSLAGAPLVYELDVFAAGKCGQICQGSSRETSNAERVEVEVEVEGARSRRRHTITRRGTTISYSLHLHCLSRVPFTGSFI